ncbi:unnamed protein product [Pneumocystis jirovecii]|uniref:Anaphase-promoting complex subunit 4 WD40 domain-containing protein n=2 Tax=Pneumocystis jirovecii TaxID=42068 RepID=L0PBS3_PNEJI|nr:COMPASS subunit protein SWD1 [Pneumocystis jirovecii RU7]KTW31323.1 hypothetical protein T551_01395 [Pneumocystis jirovecii RU7]CCJ29677.1 unnamed protein product [Pneumocystis jirovecii]
MNLELLNPFSQEYPESLTSSLSYGHAMLIRFNKKGDHLAAGLFDGAVIIWDLLTNGVSRVLKGHTRPIQSVCWSIEGRYLLSAARDWRCVLWDLKDGSRIKTIRFDAPIWGAELHPFNRKIFVASLLEDVPILTDISKGDIQKHILPTIPKRPLNEGAEEGEIDEKLVSQDIKQFTLVCTFNSTGKYIYSGTTKGWLNIISSTSLEILYSFRLTNSNIKQIRLSPTGKTLVVNSTDRIVRTLSIIDDPENLNESSIEIEHKFQDVINRFQWNACAFNYSGEYVMASTYQSAHVIYIWDRNTGSLVKILEGPKEEFIDIDWHPVYPLIAAAGLETGTIYIWSIPQTEGWSAFAPDFTELEENVLYEEREDEFDIVPEETKKNMVNNDNDDDVDIITIDNIQNTVGSTHVEGFLLPVLFDSDYTSSSETDDQKKNKNMKKLENFKNNPKRKRNE